MQITVVVAAEALSIFLATKAIAQCRSLDRKGATEIPFSVRSSYGDNLENKVEKLERVFHLNIQIYIVYLFCNK